ncbi:MAG: hypothetical protein R6W73_03740 [Candidatus Saliniplasma sp.]
MPRGQGGRGRQPGGKGLGPGGNCVCPNCGHEEEHQRGVPCYEKTCPECGSKMTRG